MNISPDGVTVRFKTKPESLFEVEKSGDKSNTVQILDACEASQIRRKPPTKIIIQRKQETFLRTITHIHMELALGKVITTFSWTNEEHHYHTIFNETGQDPYAHTMRLDEDKGQPHKLSPATIITEAKIIPATEEPSLDNGFAEVIISKQMCNILQNIAHGRSINMVIHELYQIYLDKHAEERGALHD